MRVFLVTLLLCVAAFSTVYASQERPLRQNYTITVIVDCLDTATEIVRALPGYNLDSSTNVSEWQRTAEFRRRVQSDALRDIQQILRDLGEVVRENETAAHLGTGIMDLDVRIAATEQELERLTALMAASTSLDVLIAVNDRVNAVARGRDDLIGQLNVLTVDSRGPIVNITLIEHLPGRPAPPAEGFGPRVRESFGSSWNRSRSAAASFIVGVVRVFLPLVVWAVILGIIGLVAWRLYYNRRGDRLGRLCSHDAVSGRPGAVAPTINTPDDKKEEPPCEENM